MKKIGAIEFSFAWIVAIVIGIAILSMAVFVSVKIIGVGNTETGAKTSKEIGILLNPLETGFESSRSASFTMPIETRVYGSCNEDGNFGNQLISVSQKNFNKWSETDLKVGFENKYIFNEEFAEGKKFYVFSKPFEFPFKIADLIYLTSANDEYCFMGAPENIKNEIKNLNQGNLISENCTENSKKVCFESGIGCDIYVDYSANFVSKNSDKMYYETDALMYAAIFSDKEIYECQVKRLMKRIYQLSLIYSDKIVLTSREGCDSNLESDLSALRAIVSKVESSANLGLNLKTLVEGIQDKNKYSGGCKLY